MCEHCGDKRRFDEESPPIYNNKEEKVENDGRRLLPSILQAGTNMCKALVHVQLYLCCFLNTVTFYSPSQHQHLCAEE